MNGFQAHMNAEYRQKYPKNALQAALKAWRRPFRMSEKPFFGFFGLFSDIKSAHTYF